MKTKYKFRFQQKTYMIGNEYVMLAIFDDDFGR